MANLLKMISGMASLEGFAGAVDDGLLSPDQVTLAEQLISVGQQHVFEGWDPPGVNDDRKRELLTTLSALDKSYTDGGLLGYIENARKLLADAKAGKNPYQDCTPTNPEDGFFVDLSKFGPEYDAYEQAAMEHLHEIAIVLVAGGLGERLGYSGIKLDIPVQVVDETSYLAHYASVITAMEDRMQGDGHVPLVIMTSEDTDEKTRASLKSNGYFGLAEDQVILLKQEPVPAVADNDGHLAIKKDDNYALVLKPHGHGDIHKLLHESGWATRLYDQGKRHLLCIQDTNGQVFNAALAAVGVSIRKKFDFNFVAVKRIAKEAVGCVVRLVDDATEKAQTVNVEYNHLDALLKETVSPEGDVPDAQGYSPFAGNINILVIRLEPYLRVLANSEGVIPELVNPKYADEAKTTFQKPTRLETLMQDVTKLFESDERVGATTFERRWCFSANKNNVEDARKKCEEDGPPESAASAESDFYYAGRKRCRMADMKIIESPQTSFLGIPFVPGPRVILAPSFALSLKEVRDKIKGGHLEKETTLILDGPDILLENVELRQGSALVIRACKGAKVTVKDVEISNEGFELVSLTKEELESPKTPEYLKIRGYGFEDRGARICRFDEPGEYTIS